MNPIARWWRRFNQWRAPSRLRLGVVGGLVTLACSLALLPVVRGGFWMNRSIVLVAAIVTAGAVMRTLRVPLPLLPLGACFVLLGGLSALFAPEAAFAGVIPTPAAIEQLRSLLASGRADAWASVPPAEQTPGLLLIVVATVGAIALVVDTLAVGLDLPTLALLPLGGLYAAPWLVGAGFPPPASLILLLVSWLALLSAHEWDRIRALVPGAAPSPALPTVTAVTCCLALAIGVTGWLPAAGTGKRTGPQGPLALSIEPIVSLRQSLIAASGRTVLTYRTTAQRPDYLRLAVLELFDGEQWRISEPATRRSPEPTGVGPAVKYELTIGPLAGAVIPSPAGTVSAWTDTDVGLDPVGLPTRATGWVSNTEALLRVRSLGWTAQQLARAAMQPTPAPAGTSADPTSLVGPEAAALAREVTSGATNPFDRAIALQRWFTSTGGFRYSTAVSDDDADLASFLKRRVGYCEQFAATMAIMARTLGIPARVMVGFTPGRFRGGLWTVSDSDAHAWPELWMGAAGWVRFEPTPRTGAISTPGYALEEVPASQPSAEPEPGPASSQSQSVETDAPRESELAGGGAPKLSGSLGVAALAGLLTLSGLPALIRWRRRRGRRFSGPNGPQEAYREVVDTMIDLGLDNLASSERATLMSLSHGLHSAAGAAADRIATALERIRYGPPADTYTVAPTGGTLGGTVGGENGSTGPGFPDSVAPGSASVGSASVGNARPRSSLTGSCGPAEAWPLDRDVEVLRRALTAKAYRRYRVLAVVLPRSLWR